MPARTKVLVVYKDLDVLSKIYLGLLHRNYKVEASDQPQEIIERLKRLNPDVIVLGKEEYLFVMQSLKTPAIVLVEKEEITSIPSARNVVAFEKPVQIDRLIKSVEEIIA